MVENEELSNLMDNSKLASSLMEIKDRCRRNSKLAVDETKKVSVDEIDIGQLMIKEKAVEPQENIENDRHDENTAEKDENKKEIKRNDGEGKRRHSSTANLKISTETENVLYHQLISNNASNYYAENSSSPKQVMTLSPKTLMSLSPKVLASISPKMLSSLSPKMLSSLSPKTLASLSPKSGIDSMVQMLHAESPRAKDTDKLPPMV